MMENSNVGKLLTACKGIVMNCERNVVIIRIFGEYRIFLCSGVNLKSRECRWNEIIDGQDITEIVHNFGFNFTQNINNNRLNELTQSIHKETFKWGSEEYIWFTRVTQNHG